MDLFDHRMSRDPTGVPLAERMRPRRLADVIGQRHLLGEGKLLARAITGDRAPSLVLWGPPGSGKTSVARAIAAETSARFESLSAVLGTVADVRRVVAEAAEQRRLHGKRTILFVDEIHRFHKAQQDAFLPHVERGTITLIGATTENPSFAVNAALLSRCRVFHLEPLSDDDLVALLERALGDEDRGLGRLGAAADRDAIALLAARSGGDARRALDALELVARHAVEGRGAPDATPRRIDRALVEAALDGQVLPHDKAGEAHYNLASAFIKSMRGSDPDAAVYYLARLVEAGEDPLFVLRRMLIFASEDVGNADPNALRVVTSADEAFRRMGMPEGVLPLTQAALYLACAPKSNAVLRAWSAAQADVRAKGALPVPMKLRNAATAVMREWGYGEGYVYPHDAPEGWVERDYLPDGLRGRRYYEPTTSGIEARIRERLEKLRAARSTSGENG